MGSRLHPADFAFAVVMALLLGIFITSIGWGFFDFFLAAAAGSTVAILLRRELWRVLAAVLGGILVGALYYHIYFSVAAVPVPAPMPFSWLMPFAAAMAKLKLAIIAAFNNLLPPDEAALLGGITFGARATFPKPLKEAMALSGTTHLVAVSGYNITIVVLAVRGIFARFFGRRITVFFAVIVLILFMMMVGGQASAVRAAVMAFLALLARELGEPFSMRNPIVFTAGIMVLLNPDAMVNDVGFILSFLALIGIVALGPPLQKLFHFAPGDPDTAGALGWKESALTTLSAQLMVLPVLTNRFGNVSLLSVLANVLIVATVPLTMLLGFATALLGLFSTALAAFPAEIAGLFLSYELFVIRLMAGLAVPLPAQFNSPLAFAGYYGTIAIFIFSHYGRMQKP